MSGDLLLIGPDAFRTDAAEAVALGQVLLRHGADVVGDVHEIVRVHVPVPTAAFSRRDSLQPGLAAAVTASRAHGFTPVIRPMGGRLAAYDEGSVVVDHVLRVANAQAGLHERFEQFAALHRQVLAMAGIAVGIGEVPGEYCPGEFSLNLDGRRKVAGSAQRVTRDGWVFSTVIQVTGADRTRAVLVEAYDALGYDLDPATVGALDEQRADVTPAEIADAMLEAYGGGSARSSEELAIALGARLGEAGRDLML